MSVEQEKPGTGGQNGDSGVPGTAMPAPEPKQTWAKRLLSSPLFVAIIGAVVGAVCWPAGAAVVQHFTAPPGVSMLTSLMNEEATGSLAHDSTSAIRIYAP